MVRRPEFTGGNRAGDQRRRCVDDRNGGGATAGSTCVIGDCHGHERLSKWIGSWWILADGNWVTIWIVRTVVNGSGSPAVSTAGDGHTLALGHRRLILGQETHNGRKTRHSGERCG